MQGVKEQPRWWQTAWFASAAILLSMVPLLAPGFAPITDMPGHIGRYRILAEAGQMPLARHYAVEWAAIGNLGVDSLVLWLAPLLGIEGAAKLIVLLIPAVTVAAMLWAAREAHGRVPATAAFAFPLAYSYPFQLGFVNFALSGALALAGLALWIRMARVAPSWARIVLFVPISCLIWMCHSFGWAMLGLFVFGAEWAIRTGRAESRLRAAIVSACICAPLALPQLLATVFARQPLSGDTGDWFFWLAKAQWVISILRERWEGYDLASLLVLVLVLWYAIRSKQVSFARSLSIPALLCLAAFILLPRIYAGGAYVDMRILPYALMLGLLAIALPEGRVQNRFAIGATAFFIMRTVGTTVAFLQFAAMQAAELAALPSLPVGAGVLVLVNEPNAQWANDRLTHLAGIAIARRRVFTNEQWALPGQQLIHPLHPAAAPFDRDPSQLVFSPVPEMTRFDPAIATFDRGTFGYVWTIGFPTGRAKARDVLPIWSNGRSTVYRVVPIATSGGRHEREPVKGDLFPGRAAR